MKTKDKLLMLSAVFASALAPGLLGAQGPAPQVCSSFDDFAVLNNPNPTLPSGAALPIGTIHGQDGWTPANLNGGWTVSDLWGYTMSSSGRTPGRAVDEGIVVLPTGGKAWRISNGRDFGGAFSTFPFSPILPDALVAGETGAHLFNAFGPDHTHPLTEPANQGRVAQTKYFYASFDFKSETDGAQPGLKIEIDASAKQSSARYAWMRIEDDNGGLDFNTDGGYAAKGLSYSQWHHVQMEIQFVDGLNQDGSGNDIVTITVDGAPPIVTTTWEDYYAAYEPTRYPHAVDSLMFRIPSGSAAPALLSHGLLINNVCLLPPPLEIICPPDAVVPTDPGKCEAGLDQIGEPTVTGGAQPVRVAPFVPHNYGTVTLTSPYQAANFNDLWDLTAGDLMLTFTYDGTGMSKLAGAHAWSELGIRSSGSGNFNPNGQGIWLATDYGSLAESPNALAANDKLILQKQGGHGEADYNRPTTPGNPGANYGFWFDRDGVDPWQDDDPATPFPGGSSVPWGAKSGATYNTGGRYNVVIVLHATGPNSGVAYMTVNGVYQGFYAPGYHAGQPDLYPAGMTFSGDMTKMQVFYGIWGYGASSMATFENIQAWYTPQSLPVGTTPVSWIASDAAGYSVSCVQQVTVLSARDRKTAVVGILSEMTPPSDKGDANKLREAIKNLRKSLEGGLWMDGMHLSTKQGQKVFQDEKDTIGKLQDLVKKGYQVVPLQAAIEELVAIDRTLAEVAINECTDPKAIAKAEDELGKGDVEAATGRPENAVEHYRNAWQHAAK